MLILGIDPGFAIVGFGLVEADRGRQRLVQCGAITTPAGEPLPARLRQIADDMDLLLAQFQPQAMAVEELFFNNNITTAVVGYGLAEKRQVMDMTRRLLNLSAVPKPDDAADAVAIALCHARSFTSRLQSPDAARPGSGRYEVRKQVR